MEERVNMQGMQEDCTCVACSEKQEILKEEAVIMDKQWTCKVCEKPGVSLCVLPCGHRFCDRCLQLWVGIYVDQYRGNWNEFPCQACWTVVKVPDRGLCEFRQDYQVRALQDQLSQLCMASSSGGGPGVDGMDQGMGAECQPCMAGQPGHSNHHTGATFDQPQGLYNPATMVAPGGSFPNPSSALPSENPALPGEAAAVPGDQDMQTEQGGNQDALTKTSSSPITPGCQYVASFEVEHAYELTMPPIQSTQKRLCFPSCHTYEHHMF